MAYNAGNCFINYHNGNHECENCCKIFTTEKMLNHLKDENGECYNKSLLTNINYENKRIHFKKGLK